MATMGTNRATSSTSPASRSAQFERTGVSEEVRTRLASEDFEPVVLDPKYILPIQK